MAGDQWPVVSRQYQATRRRSVGQVDPCGGKFPNLPFVVAASFPTCRLSWRQVSQLAVSDRQVRKLAATADAAGSCPRHTTASSQPSRDTSWIWASPDTPPSSWAPPTA